MKLTQVAKVILLASLSLPVYLPAGHAVEPVEWNSHPIKIPLQVGEQRLIHFPDHVQFGRPSSLTDKLDVVSMQGTLYLTAKEEFAPTQVKVRLNDSGDIVLLDLVAIPHGSQALDDVVVSVPGSEAGSGNSHAEGQGNGGNAGSPQSAAVEEDPYKDTPFDVSAEETLSPEDMIIYASRQFYAPPRLRINDSRFSRIAVNKDSDTTDLFIDTSYGLFTATPIEAWSSGSGQYLTAVRLVNNKPFAVNVNPFHLNMQYAYAAPQHIRLSQANTPGDTTMLYIVTDRPFEESRYESPAPWQPAQPAGKPANEPALGVRHNSVGSR